MEDNEQDKSELPTPFKLKKGREKGVVARGVDLGFATGLAAFLGYVWMSGPRLGGVIKTVGHDGFIASSSLAEGGGAVVSTTAILLSPALKPLAFMAGAIFLLVLLLELIQTGFVFSTHALKPDFNRLNPANNLKRLFSLRILIETAKNVLKLAAYSTVAYLVIRHVLASDIGSAVDGRSLFKLMFRVALRLVGVFVLLAAFFAVLDQIIVRRDFLKKMRMSKRELRRELRDREGEPRLKQKRKQLHAEFVKAGKSMRNIKKADVLVTNPTHYAVALQYEPGAMFAPVVVSAGANRLAQRLKQQAFVYGIPIYEDRELARELYFRCALESPVPEHCYKPVAKIYNAMRQRTLSNQEAQQDV